jgi:membrane protease YdiL (CAAX protease family)
MTSQWPLHLLGLIVVPGLLEQTLAQGFIYRNLREGRSFFKAATFSAVFWGLSHSYVLLGGYTKEDISFLFQALIGSFLFAYPGAFLFERGNNVIWGFALCHIGIDAPGNVVDFVGESTNSGIWGLSILIGAVGCVGLIFLIGKWLIPEPKKV